MMGAAGGGGGGGDGDNVGDRIGAPDASKGLSSTRKRSVCVLRAGHAGACGADWTRGARPRDPSRGRDAATRAM